MSRGALVTLTLGIVACATPMVGPLAWHLPQTGVDNGALERRGSQPPRKKATTIDGALLTYIARRWWPKSDGAPEWNYECTFYPPHALVSRGTARRVDRMFGGYGVGDVGKTVFHALGGGVEDYAEDMGSGGDFYRDRSGLRLLALHHGGCGAEIALVVSSVSRHAAKPVRLDLSLRRTEHGLAIGSTKRELVARLGTPSHTGRVDAYEVLWYFGRPEWVSVPGQRFQMGYCAGYALRDGRIVEIMLYCWSTEKHG